MSTARTTATIRQDTPPVTDPVAADAFPQRSPGPPPVRYVRIRRSRLIGAGLGGALLCTATGYGIATVTGSGGATAAAPAAGSDPCDGPRKQREDLATTIKAGLKKQFGTTNVATSIALRSTAGPSLLTAAHITVNNPACFTATDVAENQQVLAAAGR